MTELQQRIKEAVQGGMSHRKAAAHFGVSLRQVQKAINPEGRRKHDENDSARWRTRYRSDEKFREYWVEYQRQYRKKMREIDPHYFKRFPSYQTNLKKPSHPASPS